jgi:hypothetical protein
MVEKDDIVGEIQRVEKLLTQKAQVGKRQWCMDEETTTGKWRVTIYTEKPKECSVVVTHTGIRLGGKHAYRSTQAT